MPGLLPRPVEDIDAAIGPQVRAGVDEALRISAVGSPETVRRQLAGFVKAHAPDEVILTGQIHDHAARLKSFEIAADILRSM